MAKAADKETESATLKPRADAPHVYAAINDTLRLLSAEGISKDQTNKFDNYKFRGIDDVYNALSRHLAKSGLNILPNVRSKEIEQRETQKGGVQFHCVVGVEYTLSSMVDGSAVSTFVYGEAMDRGDKAINKAMSAAYKLLAFQVFCIPIEGQDSEQESPELAAPKKAASKPAAKETPKNPDMSMAYDAEQNKQAFDWSAGKIDSFDTIEAVDAFLQKNKARLTKLPAELYEDLLTLSANKKTSLIGEKA